MKKSIIQGFILSLTSVLMPYLLDKNHVNTAEWSVWVQFLVLWFLLSIVVNKINYIKENK